MKKQIIIKLEDSDMDRTLEEVSARISDAIHFNWTGGAESGRYENGERYGYEFEIEDIDDDEIGGPVCE